MKNLSAIVAALFMMLTTIGTAAAHQNNGIEGLMLGGAGGAIVGQAITRNSEGVIVGAIIGSTLGMLIDIGSARDRLVIVDQPRPVSRVSFVYDNHRDHRRDGWSHGNHHRSDRRWRHDRRDH